MPPRQQHLSVCGGANNKSKQRLWGSIQDHKQPDLAVAEPQLSLKDNVQMCNSNAWALFSTATQAERCSARGFGETMRKSREKLTLRAPPNSRQATAFLMSAWPKMLGATLLKMCSCRLGCAANALKAASSSILHMQPACHTIFQ